MDLALLGEGAARPDAESPAPTPVPPTQETPDGILLPPGTRHEPALGRLGHPVNRRTPFYIGLTGALGVAIAYVLVRAIADVAGVLLLIGLALFIAVGLNPAVEWLERKGRRRGVAVGLIVGAFIAFVGGFVAAAVPPTVHEVHDLVKNLPTYRHNLEQGKGWLGSIVTRLHLQSYVRRSANVKIDFAGGFLGAGKLILSGVTGTVTVCVLTVYFLIALPSVKRLWLGVVPLSRRGRAELLTDEVFDRVGGFVLGNIITSIVTGIGTTIWLLAFGVPYAVLLGLFVAIIDLLPIIGSTVGGVVVSLVALVKGLPVAIATACYYIAYRFFEDYLLTPRVMRHTVRISPGTTIIAVLLGGALLGLAGALVAIPVAATIYLLLEEIVIPRANRT